MPHTAGRVASGLPPAGRWQQEKRQQRNKALEATAPPHAEERPAGSRLEAWAPGAVPVADPSRRALRALLRVRQIVDRCKLRQPALATLVMFGIAIGFARPAFV